MTLGMLGWLPAIAEIDKRKLKFLQKLCTMPLTLLTRTIFNFRLHLYTNRRISGQSWYIPDVCRILRKYNLFNIIESYLETDFS
jgi:hypothetical protein